MRPVLVPFSLALVLTGAAAGEPTPSLTLVVLNKADNAMAIINRANGTVVATVPVGRNPHEAAVSDDGRLAFSSNMQANTVSVIDLTTQKELHRVDLPNLRTAHGRYFADGKLYFSAEGSNSIARYDPFTDHIDWARDSGQNSTHMLVMTKDWNKIFASNMGSGSVGMFERAPGEQEYRFRVIQVGRNPEAIALSPDGKRVGTAKFGDSHVAIIDATASAVIGRFSLSAQGINRLKFTPDGQHVLLSDSDNGDLIILDAVSHKEIKRLKVDENCEGILVTRQSGLLATRRNNFVSVIDLKRLELTGHIRPGNGPDAMAWAVQQ